MIAFIFMALILCHSSQSLVGAETYIEDLQAVRSLRSLLVMPSGSPVRSWWDNGSNSDPCDAATRWHGISCEWRNGKNYIYEIKLPALSLRGQLDKWYIKSSSLQSLEVLDLSTNAFKGSIPWNIRYLKALRKLKLNVNCLSGYIPGSIGNLKQLEVLDLDGGYQGFETQYCKSGNTFGGGIPGNLKNLKKLQELNLHRLSLEGTIPWFVGTLYELEMLDLSGNRFKGPMPAKLFSLPRVKSLSLDDNSLSGTIPGDLAWMPKLEVLVLEDNNLKGRLPAGLPRNLEYLDLHGNDLTGTVPAAWASSAPRLEAMLLHDNRLEGSLPANIGLMPRLRAVSVAYNSKLCGPNPGLPYPSPGWVEEECKGPGGTLPTYQFPSRCTLWPEDIGTELGRSCNNYEASMGR